MTAKAHIRGHPIQFENDRWEYLDGIPTTQERPCVRCKRLSIEGRDACLGKLKSVMSACCGHGVTMSITFADFNDWFNNLEPMDRINFDALVRLPNAEEIIGKLDDGKYKDMARFALTRN